MCAAPTWMKFCSPCRILHLKYPITQSGQNTAGICPHTPMPQILLSCSIIVCAKKHIPMYTQKAYIPADIPGSFYHQISVWLNGWARRIDRSAVLLTVQVQHCLDKGVVFFKGRRQPFSWLILSRPIALAGRLCPKKNRLP